MTDEVRRTLEKELAEIDDQVERLERYKSALKTVMQARDGLRGPGTSLSSERGYTPQVVTAGSIEGPTEGKIPAEGQPSTLEMARTVLRNLNGPERTPTELRELIKSTYGVEPAKTLDQMLYKRATAGNTFY